MVLFRRKRPKEDGSSNGEESSAKRHLHTRKRKKRRAAGCCPKCAAQNPKKIDGGNQAQFECRSCGTVFSLSLSLKGEDEPSIPQTNTQTANRCGK